MEAAPLFAGEEEALEGAAEEASVVSAVEVLEAVEQEVVFNGFYVLLKFN